MKINNQSSVFSLLSCLLLVACQSYGSPAQAGYKGYWLDVVRDYQNQPPVLPAYPNPFGQSVGGETGVASYYAQQYQGYQTASGEMYDQYALTAAHPSLPFGTRLRVTNLDNGRVVIVRVNDRGPFKAGRILDVSWAAALQLGLIL